MRVRMTLVAAALAAIGAVIVYAFDPATARFYPPCAFHALTGLQCPGCGGTRALHALLHGDVGAAMRLNPFLFVFMGAATAVAARPRLLTQRWFAWVAAGALLAWGVIRNL
ncbi:MAG TPA: DUF2752 domain-containing protein [Thermoanaerobaculia bacterium]|nr:DUF2752 domain-containing protein [Thermoanaerobaculia bacterium]